VVDSEKTLKICYFSCKWCKRRNTLAKKLNDGKQPFLWSYRFTVPFWPVLLGLYTLAYIDCASFKIKSNDSLLLHFLK